MGLPSTLFSIGYATPLPFTQREKRPRGGKGGSHCGYDRW